MAKKHRSSPAKDIIDRLTSDERLFNVFNIVEDPKRPKQNILGKMMYDPFSMKYWLLKGSQVCTCLTDSAIKNSPSYQSNLDNNKANYSVKQPSNLTTLDTDVSFDSYSALDVFVKGNNRSSALYMVNGNGDNLDYLMKKYPCRYK